MAQTNFDPTNKINISGPLTPTTTDTPADIRTRIKVLADITEIPLAYKGMIVYCEADDKYYRVKTLKSKFIGTREVPDYFPDQYEEYKTSDVVDIDNYKTAGAILPLNSVYVYRGRPTHAISGYNDKVSQNHEFIAICYAHDSESSTAQSIVVYLMDDHGNYVFDSSFDTDEAETEMQKFIASSMGASLASEEYAGLMSADDKKKLREAHEGLTAAASNAEAAAQSASDAAQSALAAQDSVEGALGAAQSAAGSLATIQQQIENMTTPEGEIIPENVVANVANNKTQIDTLGSEVDEFKTFISTSSIGDTLAYTEHEDDKYLQANGGKGNLSGCAYSIYDVTTIKSVAISCYLGKNMHIVQWGANNDILDVQTGLNQISNEIYVLKNGCVRLGVSTRYKDEYPIVVNNVNITPIKSSYILSKTEEAVRRCEEVDSSVTELAERTDTLEDSLTTEKTEIISAEIIQDKYITSSGGIGNIQGAGYTIIDINSEKKVAISCYLSNNLYIVQWDANSVILDKVTNLGNIEDKIFEIKDGCTRLGVSTRYKDSSPIIIKRVYNETLNVNLLAQNVYTLDKKVEEQEKGNKNSDDRLYSIENRIGFSFNGMENGQIIFMVDDANPIISDLYAIFHRHNMPFSEAVITTKLNPSVLANDGRPTIDVIRDMVADGGEVLSHSTSGSNCTIDALGSLKAVETALKESKALLEEAGFSVHGWVSPQGKFEPNAVTLYPKYYRYGYQASAKVGSQFAMSRPYLSNLGLDRCKQLIDEVAEGKKVQILFGHFSSDELSKFSLDDLDELLTYCESANVDVTTYRDCFYKYGSIS